MKLAELAARIHAHLTRFEKDPKINKRKDVRRLLPYYNAWARAAGRYVAVVYVSFQGSSHLTKDDAETYLAWLDAGNVGRHFEALRAQFYAPEEDT